MSAQVRQSTTRKSKDSRRGMTILRAVGLQVGLVVLTLVGVEIFLRVADFREIRLIPEQNRVPYRLPYQFDEELGWYPIPNKVSPRGERINSMGLRDIEVPPRGTGPTILFVGDSFLYGLAVNAEDRFTDRLREKLPSTRIVNAGVAAYGTCPGIPADEATVAADQA